MRLGRSAVALAVGVMLVVTGCSTATSVTPPLGAQYATQYDLSVARAECLKQAGWEVKVNEDGSSVTEGIPDSQLDQYRAADSACMESLGVDVGSGPSRAQLESAYKYYVDAVICLRDAGYEIRDAPSLQQFLDTYGTSDNWLPWLDVPLQDFPLARDACPLPPPIL